MNRNRLEIVIREDAEMTLVGFPFVTGQYLEPEQEEVEDGIMLTVNLADRNDTTAAQEQFLNASDDVLAYAVKSEIEIDGEEYQI
ncbi:MAG: hypothetical protein ACOX8T_11075 [Bacillota bacterium]|jgi:hypothetical protein